MPVNPVMTREEWVAEGKRRFGDDFRKWQFVCPLCGNVAAIGDYEQYSAKGADMNSATAECIGRYTGAGPLKKKGDPGPCDYAGYGLIRLSPVRVLSPGQPTEKPTHSFAFADPVAAA